MRVIGIVVVRTFETKLTRGSAVAEGPRDALSVEILATAAQLYVKSHFENPH